MPSPSRLHAQLLAALAALILCSTAAGQSTAPAVPPAPRHAGNTTRVDTASVDTASVRAMSDTASADSLAARTIPPPAAEPAAAPFPLAAEAELIGGGSVHALSAPLRWGAREWALAGGAIAAVGVASIADEDGRALMASIRNDGNGRVERFIEPFGAERSLHLLGGMLLAGVVLDDAKLRGTAAEGLAAGLVAAGILTPALQKAIGRSKPRDGLPPHTYNAFGGDRSLPSGHTTQAFAVASVIAMEYDHPLVQVGAYGLATAVGVSRMYRRSHYFSDVVGAAIIGTVVGRTVARYGQSRRGAVSVAPIVGGEGGGLAFRATF